MRASLVCGGGWVGGMGGCGWMGGVGGCVGGWAVGGWVFLFWGVAIRLPSS